MENPWESFIWFDGLRVPEGFFRTDTVWGWNPVVWGSAILVKQPNGWIEAGWWLGTFFSIIYGIILPNWLIFFQRGWNHQPDVIWPTKQMGNLGAFFSGLLPAKCQNKTFRKWGEKAKYIGGFWKVMWDPHFKLVVSTLSQWPFFFLGVYPRWLRKIP